METELKVGQRIDVYMVLTTGDYRGRQFTPGTLRAGRCIGELVEVIPNRKLVFTTLPMQDKREVKKVGTLIIKSLKNGNF